MDLDIRIKSFNGIGDLLFLTPSLPVIKAAYPNAKITVNTNYPALLRNNPFVDKVTSRIPARPYDTDEDGIFLGYPDPKHREIPQEHHIISDWRIICRDYGLQTDTPKLKPEIYLDLPTRGDTVRVQVKQKNNWHGKKSWPHAKEFCEKYGYEPIGQMVSIESLIWTVAESKMLVCIEGGISHISRAVDTPAVVIFGGFAHPYWSGYDDQINIVKQKSCSWCYNPDPCVSQHECMEEITPEQVHNVLFTEKET